MKFLTREEMETFKTLEQDIDLLRNQMIDVGEELIAAATPSRRKALHSSAKMVEPGGGLKQLVNMIQDIHDRLLLNGRLHPDTVDFIINSED